MNQKQMSRKINQLAKLKAKISKFNDAAEMLVLQITKHGGGESKEWIAQIVTMPKRTVVIRKHKQLRLFPKT
jgi:hypothetical protein